VVCGLLLLFGMTEPKETTQTYYFERQAMRPTARAWALHIALLLLTIMTATVAGSLFPFGKLPVFADADPQTFGEAIWFISSLPGEYLKMIAGTIYLLLTDGEILRYGLSFSLSLIFILVAHELGHYIACRIYKVDATLPFFIPTPPLIGPAGTFGAFIKIMSPLPSRKAVFDIGVAGPIAGFIALLPIAYIGIRTMKSAPPESVSGSGLIVFADPLLVKLLGAVMGIDVTYGIGNAFYFAAWVGLLVTALNLIPSGQLDGGHAIYAVFGENVHYWTGRIAFVVMAVLSVGGLVFFNSPSGFLIAILLGIMMRIKHPEPWDRSPLDTKRKVIAVITLLIFALCFVPFPIKIT
jgi:membrane-associated protease RseP (regulator of RpoE activity)